MEEWPATLNWREIRTGLTNLSSPDLQIAQLRGPLSALALPWLLAVVLRCLLRLLLAITPNLALRSAEDRLRQPLRGALGMGQRPALTTTKLAICETL